MERYDYKEVVMADLMDFIKDNYQDEVEDLKNNESCDRTTLESTIYDDAFNSDRVTGNASGSYFCNTWKAEEAICHNFDLLAEAFEAFGSDISELSRGAEVADVTIRCYLLSNYVGEALDKVLEQE